MFTLFLRGFNNDEEKQTVEAPLQDLKKQIESRLRKPKNEVRCCLAAR